MRHPSNAKHEGDLSRLTTSSSSSSTSSNNSNFYIPDCEELTTSNFTSSYLPEVIDPLEWQISRKRKERQDSTSSTTQDRKLVRSNSEEYIPSVDYEVIRRVCSHEEFKHPLQDKTNGIYPGNGRPLGGGQASELLEKKASNNEVQEILKETHRRAEVSPARSRTFDFSHKYRISPHRDGGRNSVRNVDDVDGEHERRRSSERFCKARAQPGRNKMQSSKKQTKYVATRLRGGRDENVYKYDIAASKIESRGFVSKPKSDENKPLTSKQLEVDNGIVHMSHNENAFNDSHVICKSPKTKRKHETLPWDISFQNDTPVVCPRFSDTTFDHVHHSRDNNVARSSDNRPALPSINGMKILGHLTKVENLKTREIMQSIKTPSSFASPDEKLKQINKRLVALKKRVAIFEESYEKDNGYRPSQADKLNDHYIKNVMAEIHKLRKEKQQLKTDPGAAIGFRSNIPGGIGNRIAKMKDVLVDIESRLQEKRSEEQRPNTLEAMSTDQLVQEKTAVQRGLQYFESVFGRPETREERDIARDLYDRYRALKRTLNRSASLSISGGGGISELQTIHEHEAMQFVVVAPAAIGSDLLLAGSSASSANMTTPMVESPTSAVSTDSTDTTTTSSVHENIHQLSIEELWKHLDVTREKKRELRRTIKEFEEVFEEQNGRRMLKTDRAMIEDTYNQYKQKKAQLRLLDALVKKHMAK